MHWFLDMASKWMQQNTFRLMHEAEFTSFHSDLEEKIRSSTICLIDKMQLRLKDDVFLLYNRKQNRDTLSNNWLIPFPK